LFHLFNILKDDSCKVNSTKEPKINNNQPKKKKRDGNTRDNPKINNNQPKKKKRDGNTRDNLDVKDKTNLEDEDVQTDLKSKKRDPTNGRPKSKKDKQPSGERSRQNSAKSNKNKQSRHH
jgi:hypothetical protein